MLFILVILTVIIIVLTKNIDYKKGNSYTRENIFVEENTPNNNYKKNEYIMTYTELRFYRELIKITEKLELIIFIKVRLADIVQHRQRADFNRIKAKHIDFVLCNKDNCKVRAYIELDDYTHNRQNRIERDTFINNILGKNLIRIRVTNNYNLEEIEQKINDVIN